MYDVIVMGARCAGSPTAMLLARKGYKVLLVDKATFPSDKMLSTHAVLHPGGACLSRWGLLNKLKEAETPPARQLHVDFGGGLTLQGSAPPLDGCDAVYTPRRIVLDNILFEGAVASGLEARQGYSVDDLIMEGDRIVGIRGHDLATKTVTEERCKLLIAADGINSLVVKKLKVPYVHNQPTYSGVYFSYFSGAPLPNDYTRIHNRENRMLAIAPTNNGLTLWMDYFPIELFHEYVTDVEGTFMASWQKHVPEYYERLRAGKREDRWIGTGFQPNYFRKPYGPGFLLSGDAFIHHDSINPSGITYAFVNSESCAEYADQILTGKMTEEEAGKAYEAKVHKRWKPHFDFIVSQARFEPPPPDLPPVLMKAQSNPKIVTDLLGAIEGFESHQDFFTPENLKRIAES